MLALTACARSPNASSTPTPSSRDATTMLVENTLNWLKGGTASASAARSRRRTSGCESEPVPEIDFGVLPAIRPRRMFTTANFPGASGDRPHARAEPLRPADGPRQRGDGNARIDEDTGQIHLSRAGDPARADARLRLLRAGPVAHAAEPDVELRPALRAAAAVLRAEQQLFDGDDGRTCAACRASPGGGCNLFQPGHMPGRGRRSSIWLRASGSTRPTGTTSRRASAFNWTPSAESGFLGTLLGEDGDTSISAGFAMAFNRNGLADFTASSARTPASRSTVNRSQGRQSRRAAAAAPRTARGSVRRRFRRSPRVPADGRRDAGRQHLRLRSAGPVVAVVAGRHRARRSARRWRSRPATSARAARISGRRNIIQRDQHHRERVPERVPARAAEPAGEHRGGTRGTFRYLGPGTGTSPLPIFLAYFSGSAGVAAGTAANYTSTCSRTTRSSLRSRGSTRSRTRRPTRWTRTRRGARTRPGPACRRTSSSRTPICSGAPTSPTAATRRSTTRLVLELRRRMSERAAVPDQLRLRPGRPAVFISFRRRVEFRRDTGARARSPTPGRGLGVPVAVRPRSAVRRQRERVCRWLHRRVGLTGTARVQSGQLFDLGNVCRSGSARTSSRTCSSCASTAARRCGCCRRTSSTTRSRRSASARRRPPATGRWARRGPVLRAREPVRTATRSTRTATKDLGTWQENFGDCAPGSTVVTGPLFKSFDVGVFKQVRIKGNVNFEFRLEILNAFNNTNFVPVGGVGDRQSAAGYEVLA